MAVNCPMSTLTGPTLHISCSTFCGQARSISHRLLQAHLRNPTVCWTRYSPALLFINVNVGGCVDLSRALLDSRPNCAYLGCFQQ